MERRTKIILGLLAVVLISIIATEIVRPKPINWRPSYTAASKIPFGCFVLFNELPTIFSKSDIETVEESLYDVLVKRDSSRPSNYVMINDLISLDQQETNQLLNYVANGNHVFLATNEFGGPLSDTLNISLEQKYNFREDPVTADLTNKRFKNKSFIFEKGTYPAYFSSVDTANTVILGHINFEDNSIVSNEKSTVKKFPNFIKTEFGKGSFLINTLPVAYTNYYVLGANKSYVAHTFSYLNDGLLYWDDYKKSGRAVVTSPMRFVLNQPALKWGYYLTLISLLLFVIFKGKREQRIIPVIKPLENSSVEFARTVGSLYHQHKDYTNLNSKKISFFFSYIRSKYYLDTSLLDEKLMTRLAAKSGQSLNETKQLIEFILSLKNKPIHTEEDTIALSKKIHTFKQSYGR